MSRKQRKKERVVREGGARGCERGRSNRGWLEEERRRMADIQMFTTVVAVPL